ncbi:hypothetical protein FIU95_05610 [Microbulbifer sp. THAF38]|nr:hypothetical protein FIU95_05610 [Microbulbifer sp. THAF38]
MFTHTSPNSYIVIIQTTIILIVISESISTLKPKSLFKTIDLKHPDTFVQTGKMITLTTIPILTLARNSLIS